MIRRLYRCSYACIAWLALVTPAFAADSRAATVDRAIAQTALMGSHLGVLVSDAESGKVYYARNADDAFTPASTVKVLTGAAALEVLGRRARFTSSLLLHGKQRGDRFYGEVVFRGDSDPALRSGDLRQAGAAVVAMGIRSISGNVRVENTLNETRVYPAGWLLEDRPFAYAAPSADIFLDGNCIHTLVRPGARVNAPADIRVASHDAGVLKQLGLGFRNATLTTAANTEEEIEPLWTDSAIGFRGPIHLGGGATAEEVAVPDAKAFVRAALLSNLQEQGIAVTAAPIVSGETRIVWTHRSPTVAELVRTMWLRSDNQYAEALLLHIGAASQQAGDLRNAGIARELALLRSHQVDTRRALIYDGSGLSRSNVLTPRLFASLFRVLWHDPIREDLLNGLPLAGTRGTLAHAFAGTSIAGAYYAKTGGMRDIANMSGYLRSKKHGWLSVSIFADHAPISDANLRRLQTKILLAYID